MVEAKSSEFYTWHPPSNDETTFDDILIYLGEFGKYQKYLFCVLMIFCLFLTFVYFTQTFLVVVPVEYWCKLPLVEGVSSERLKDLMIPSAKLVPYEGHELPYSRCWIYDLPVDKVLSVNEPDESWPVKKCNNWEYKISYTDVPYLSVAAEQNWVCDHAYKATLSQSIFFLGSIVGGLLFGWLADRFGRVPVLMGTNMMGFIGGISTVYITQFWQFCACRFVVGLAYDNNFVIAYILVLEYVGPKWRTFTANMSYAIFYTIGATTLPWLAYGIANWKSFSVLTSVPLASVIVAPFLIPESVRWLISRGKIETAVRIIMRIEEVNGAKVPEDIYKDFLDDCLKTAEELSAEEYTFLDLFKTKRLRTFTILLTISWSVIQMTYDGHIRCLNSLGRDVFTTFTIASATEFPAVVLVSYTLDIVGRRWTLFASVFLSGLFSLFAAGLPIGLAFASFAICGRFFINISSNIAMQYGAELLPTVVRGKGMAFIHVLGYVTSILSPFIAFSSVVAHNMPMIILGTSSIIVSILCLFLPETLMEQLPQTLLAGELFGIDQKFWETPFTRKKPVEPKGHHLHARRPASRPGIIRSSMISGYLSSERRLSTVRLRASQMSLKPVKRSPLDYVDTLRRNVDQSRSQQQKQEHEANKDEQTTSKN